MPDHGTTNTPLHTSHPARLPVLIRPPLATVVVPADGQAVYRLCQLWLGLSDDLLVNRRVKEVVEAAPSAKFVPLLYQVSRI